MFPRCTSSRVQKAHPQQSGRKRGSRIFVVRPYLDVPRRPLSKDTCGFSNGRKNPKKHQFGGAPPVPHIYEQLIPTRVWGNVIKKTSHPFFSEMAPRYVFDQKVISIFERRLFYILPRSFAKGRRLLCAGCETHVLARLLVVCRGWAVLLGLF